MTIREAARHYNVPKSTLQRKTSKINNGVEVTMRAELGRFKPTFESKYEDELVRHIKDMDMRLMPFTRKELEQTLEHFRTLHILLKKAALGPRLHHTEMKLPSVQFNHGNTPLKCLTSLKLHTIHFLQVESPLFQKTEIVLFLLTPQFLTVKFETSLKP